MTPDHGAVHGGAGLRHYRAMQSTNEQAEVVTIVRNFRRVALYARSTRPGKSHLSRSIPANPAPKCFARLIPVPRQPSAYPAGSVSRISVAGRLKAVPASAVIS